MKRETSEKEKKKRGENRKNTLEERRREIRGKK